MIYEIDTARKMVADGWKLERREGGLPYLVKGDDARRVYLNVARSLEHGVGVDQ